MTICLILLDDMLDWMKRPDEVTDDRVYSAHSDVTPIAPISMLNTIAEEDYEKMSLHASLPA